AGKWKEARDHFLEAASLKPSPARRVRTYGLNFLLNYDPYAHLAHCEFRLGMFAEATQHLELSLKGGVTPAARLHELKEKVAAELSKKEMAQPPPSALATAQPTVEQPKVPIQATLIAESNPAGAMIKIDGEFRGATPLRITLPSGTHNIECAMQGFEPGHRTVDLKEGETQTIVLMLSPTPALRQEPSQSPQPQPQMKIQTPEKEAVTPSTASPSQEAPKEVVIAPKKKSSEPAVTVFPKESSQTMQNIIVLLAIAAAAVAFLFLRKQKAFSDESGRTPTVPEPVAKNAMTDSPTHDLWLESASPSPEALPVGEAMLMGIRVKSRGLPKGTPDFLGGFQLMGVLGHGGMGTTFLAKRTRDGLPVALKMPHDHLLDDPQFVQRFVREGSLGSTLHHPNIIRILEASKVEDKPFIAMELLEGETLEKKLRREGHLTVRNSLEIARDVALALDYARFKGIVHRDLKPENIMILDRGGLKVLDYGIAHLMDSPGLTTSGTFLGTPSYGAPESRNPAEVDQQSDLYSLGIILYRCLAGNLPFYSDDPLVVLDMHRSKSLPPFPPESNLPDSIFRLVQKLTEKNKTNRFENAESFLVELNRIINQLES
ncbi:protein kinase, partial [bacterium]|nr:protein kinase [bacterium]